MERASQLQQEIKQRKPFRSKKQEAALGILRTADVIHRRGEALMAPHGITSQQYNVLRILRGAEPEGLPTLEIGHRLVEQTPGITRLLDRLEKKQWVKRWRCPEDRRQVLCRISKAGLALLERMQADVDRSEEESLQNFSQNEIQALIDMLDRARKA
ncbi:MAG: MarR family transcriptional regulator [Acidobacteriales bacterium]|nr:MarR family transcriptional regulator [Terriglobales bacterium]